MDPLEEDVPSQLDDSPQAASAAPSPDVLRIQELLASGDVAAAEAAIKQLKRALKKQNHEKSDDGHVKEKKQKKEKTSSHASDSLILEADERRGRHHHEKDERRERERIEKLIREMAKVASESIRDKLKEEKKVRDRIEKDRRDVERHEGDERKEFLRLEKAAREDMEKEKREIERIMKEQRKQLEKEARKPPPKTAVVAPPFKGPQVRSLDFFGFSSEKVRRSESDQRLFSSFVQDKRIVPSRLQLWTHRSMDQDLATEVLKASDASCSSLSVSCPVPDQFCKEVVYCSFHAVGFEPAQARPSYFGTVNPAMNDEECLSLARYAGNEMPRLSTLNYDYDSGDDWDYMESDEDVDESDDEEEESEGDESDDASFIDDGDCGDSDGEQVSSAFTLRNRRYNRLRGRDKMVPSYSGAFEDCYLKNHPLAHLDSLRFLYPSFLQTKASDVFDRVLLEELSRSGVHSLLPLSQKNPQRYRPVSEHELQEIVDFVKSQGSGSASSIVETLSKRPSFAGISSTEIRRGLKRLFEHANGAFRLREVPWTAEDPRLFEKKPPKKETKRPRDQTCSSTQDLEVTDSSPPLVDALTSTLSNNIS